LQPLARNPDGSEGPQALGGDQQHKRRVAQSGLPAEPGVGRGEQRVVVLRAEGEEQVVFEARGSSMGQRLHRIEQRVMVDAMIAVRKEPDSAQG
jgi:hypothetical protein